MTNKNYRKVALIACSNGFGHIRRMLTLSKALIEVGVKPTLFAPIDKSKFLINLEKIPSPYLIDFNTNTSIDNWILSKNDYNWISDLPNMSEYDVIVCDNLIEILKLRSDAWLVGSFIWQFALPDIHSSKIEFANNLLKKYKPKMISSDLFLPSYLNEKTKLHKVGLFTFD